MHESEMRTWCEIEKKTLIMPKTTDSVNYKNDGDDGYLYI